MKRMIRICRCVAVAAFGVINLYAQVEAKAKHHRYQIIDLQPAGGPNSTESSQAVSINKHGRAVGWADLALHDPYGPNCFNGDCFVSHAYSWRNGAAIDLGALTNGVSSAALAVNDSGLIDGLSENGTIDPLTGFPEVMAVAWKNGNIINLGTFGGNQSATSGMLSNRGEIVGGALNDVPDSLANDFSQFFMFVPAATQCHAFLWRNGIIRDLGTLGGPDSIASFVNDRGQVSGNSYTNSTVNPVTHFPTMDPFFWENGHMIDVGTLGGNFGIVDWMNGRGQLVGGSDLQGDLILHPYLWEVRGPMRDLGTLGGTNGEAFAINDDGVVVGRADIAGSAAHHAFLWKPASGMKDLGTPHGDTCSTALSINNLNQVVGDSGVCGQGGNAFFWENGGPIVNLQDLIIPDTDLHVTEANFINDRGEIACIATLPDGNSHACLLVPTEETIEPSEYSAPRPSDASGKSKTTMSTKPALMSRRYSRRIKAIL